MAKRSNDAGNVPYAPEPSAASERDGLTRARETARKFLRDAVFLWAGVAFGADSEASLWTRVQCSRLLAEVAGAIPQVTPSPPQSSSDEGAGAGEPN